MHVIQNRLGRRTAFTLLAGMLRILSEIPEVWQTQNSFITEPYVNDLGSKALPVFTR